MFKIFLIFILAISIIACSDEKKENPLILALQAESPKIKNVLQNAKAHELQILLSTFEYRNNEVVFTDYAYQINDSSYYYPASTVKFPAAVMALEQLNKTPAYNLDTSYAIEGDSTATTFRKDIQDIFAMSSNTSFNNLYEFLGPDAINDRLTKLGAGPVRYSHRLSITNADTLGTKPIEFTNNLNNSFIQPGKENKPTKSLAINGTQKGKGFYRNDSLINQPMDFSKKNYLPLTTLHNIMKRVIFPEAFPETERFDLSVDQQLFLIESMSNLPRNLGYNRDVYYDSYVKFFLYGDSKDPIPEHIRIHNKVGYAYGYLTDTAYIIDTENQIAYILSATIHVNKNGVFNDDVYEYETVGVPFLAELGRQVHQILIDRK